MHGIGGTMASNWVLFACQSKTVFNSAWTTHKMLWILIQHPTWQPEFMHKMTFMNCQFHNLVYYAVQNPLLLYTLYILYIILQVTFIMYCILNSRVVKQKVYFIYYLFRSVAQFCRLNRHDCYPTEDKCVVHIQAVWRPVPKICEFVTAHFMAFKLEENESYFLASLLESTWQCRKCHYTVIVAICSAAVHHDQCTESKNYLCLLITAQLQFITAQFEQWYPPYFRHWEDIALDAWFTIYRREYEGLTV